MPATEQRLIVQAIKDLGRYVTAGDIATKTGLPILTVNRDLNIVAADCLASLEVSSQGQLFYRFGPLFESAYLKKGLSRFLSGTGKSLFDVAFFLLRVSFGVTLIASLATVAVLIVVAVMSIVQKSSNSGNGTGTANADLGLEWLTDAGRFFCFSVVYRPTEATTGSAPGKPLISSEESDYIAYTQGRYVPPGTEEVKQQGFVLNCFSYLFGDGNPNARFEEKRWQSIASLIRRSNGAVIAEQLACFTDANRRLEEATLPVLVRFDGQPSVTDRGNIVYCFPALQITSAVDATKPEPPYLEETRWTFSNQPAEAFIAVGLLAFTNFVGCMWLLRHASSITALHRFNVLIDWLSVYALFFLVFPLLRYMVLIVLNFFIDYRNAKRLASYRRLQQATAKLNDAQAFAIARTTPLNSKVVYSTDKDLLEQQFD